MDGFPSPGGDYGLSDSGCSLVGYSDDGQFPSPGGDYGLSDLGRPFLWVLGGFRFRPLAGITVFRTAFCATPRCTGF